MIKNRCKKCGIFCRNGVSHQCPIFVWNKGKSGLQTAWNKGKSLSEETKKKISDSRTGKSFLNLKGSRNGMFGKTPWNKGKKTGKPSWTSGRKMSKEFREKISGANHYNWKGGVGSINMRLRKCFEYRLWVSDVFRRDDFTCLNCGQRGGRLEAHHIKPFSIICRENNINSLESGKMCSELWNLNNGQTLCIECHKKTETYLKNNL